MTISATRSSSVPWRSVVSDSSTEVWMRAALTWMASMPETSTINTAGTNGSNGWPPERWIAVSSPAATGPNSTQNQLAPHSKNSGAGCAVGWGSDMSGQPNAGPIHPSPGRAPGPARLPGEVLLGVDAVQQKGSRGDQHRPDYPGDRDGDRDRRPGVGVRQPAHHVHHRGDPTAG